MYYKLKFRKPGKWFWTTKCCVWQSFNSQTDKLSLKLKDGSFHEIAEVSKTEFKYKQDLLDINELKVKEQKAERAAEEEKKKSQGT